MSLPDKIKVNEDCLKGFQIHCFQVFGIDNNMLTE